VRFCLARDSSSHSFKTLFDPPTRIVNFSGACSAFRELSSPQSSQTLALGPVPGSL